MAEYPDASPRSSSTGLLISLNVCTSSSIIGACGGARDALPQARMGYARPLRQVSETGGKYCRYEPHATSMPSRAPEMTSKGW